MAPITNQEPTVPGANHAISQLKGAICDYLILLFCNADDKAQPIRRTQSPTPLVLLQWVSLRHMTTI